MRQRLSDLKQKTPPNKQHTLRYKPIHTYLLRCNYTTQNGDFIICFLVYISTSKEIHSVRVIGTMSSDSDKDVEEEEGIEEEDEMFPHLSSGSSAGEDTGNASDILQQSY